MGTRPSPLYPPWQYESQFLVTRPDGSMCTAPGTAPGIHVDFRLRRWDQALRGVGKWETLGTFPPRSGYCFSSSWARSMLRSRHNLEPRHFNTSLRSGCSIEYPLDRLHADHATTICLSSPGRNTSSGPFRGKHTCPRKPSTLHWPGVSNIDIISTRWGIFRKS